MSVIDKKFSADLYEITWRVGPKNTGLRLDQFLMLFLQTWSREQIKKKIKNGGISILSRPVKVRPNLKVYYDDRIKMTTKRDELLEIEDEYWRGEKITLEWDPQTLDENEDFLVCSKPPFMSTHPTGRHLFHCASVYYESLYKKPVHSIHRLDRETSGILLLAKNPDAAKVLTDNFEKDRVQKAYCFISKILKNSKSANSFNINLRLGPKGEGLQRVVINAFPSNSHFGKSALTDFEILERINNEFAIGLAFPKTGRQHQIRVHAASSGLPLIGDKLYLGDYPLFQRFKDRKTKPEDYDRVQLPRHALHAVALRFPYKEKIYTYVSPLPYDFKKWIKENLTSKDLEMEALEKKIEKKVKNYFSRVSLR